jgi:hypothetical protein
MRILSSVSDLCPHDFLKEESESAESTPKPQAERFEPLASVYVRNPEFLLHPIRGQKKEKPQKDF